MGKTVFFQTKGMDPNQCEAGMILNNDLDYIHYFDEPCKVLISEVKIIEMKNVRVDIRKRIYKVIKTSN